MTIENTSHEFRRQRLLKRGLLCVFIALTALGLLAMSSRTFNAELTGAAEVPGPGDSDGFGRARIMLNLDQNEICYRLKVKDIRPATAAHIHQGTAGESGPVVVSLDPPTNGFSEGCVNGLARQLIIAIGKNPAGYYVNVHNMEYPAGAVRGQLTR